MTDRELIELAAKAAGYKIAWGGGCVTGWMAGGSWWNPLTDDGDTLRLAVKLGLYFGEHKNGMGCHAGISSVPGFFVNQIEHYSDHHDKCAAARRAIVMAAAKIGGER